MSENEERWRWWNYLFAVWFLLWSIGGVIAALQGRWERLIIVLIALAIGVVWVVASSLWERFSAKPTY